MPPLDQVLGPFGGLVLAVAGLVVLAREHRRADDLRDAEHAANLAYSRARSEAAEKRLDAFRDTMREAYRVTERAVALAEQAASRRRNGDRDDA